MNLWVIVSRGFVPRGLIAGASSLPRTTATNRVWFDIPHHFVNSPARGDLFFVHMAPAGKTSAIHYCTAGEKIGVLGGWDGDGKSLQRTTGVEMASSRIYFPDA